MRECRPLERALSSSKLGRRSTTRTSVPANVSSAASIIPVGPPPAITTACSTLPVGPVLGDPMRTPPPSFADATAFVPRTERRRLRERTPPYVRPRGRRSAQVCAHELRPASPMTWSSVQRARSLHGVHDCADSAAGDRLDVGPVVADGLVGVGPSGAEPELSVPESHPLTVVGRETGTLSSEVAPDRRATANQGKSSKGLEGSGAGDGNRTRVLSLGNGFGHLADLRRSIKGQLSGVV